MMGVNETTLENHRRSGLRRFTISDGERKLSVAVQLMDNAQGLPDGTPCWEPALGGGLNQDLAGPLALLVAQLIASPLQTQLADPA
jgi:hypothetical protein